MRKGMLTNIKQGIITLIPAPDKDHSLIENWRPITLLNDLLKICKAFKKWS